MFATEPYTGPLLELDNVVVTPHLAASTEEAQDRAGVIVAEQVAAALDGGVVTNAVNSPVVRPEELEVLGPFVPLAAKLGRLAMELADGGAERFVLAYHGRLADHDTRLLTAAALNGAFEGRTEHPVNYVNAPLVAAERGIRVEEETQRSSRDYTSLLSVAVCMDGEEIRVSATTIGVDDRHWLVGALGYQIEIELAPLMVFFRYDDQAGRDRQGRDAVRRGRHQHREHGRLANESGRQGADGALDRHAGAARPRRTLSRRGLRRRPFHPSLRGVTEQLPEEVERVQRVPQRGRRRGRGSRSSPPARPPLPTRRARSESISAGS